MGDQIYTPSRYVGHGLTKAGQFDVQQIAAEATKIKEITKVANHEIAQIGAHAVGAMAEVTRVASDVQRRLTMNGHRSEVFDDANNKILQVTGQNLITTANTAQKEILQQAARLMR